MNTYQTWEDLLPGNEPAEQFAQNNPVSSASTKSAPLGATDGPTAPNEVAGSKTHSVDGKTTAPKDSALKQQLLSRLPEGVSLPADVLALIDEYETAEKRLRQLTGQQAAEPVDPREAARFPVREHTAASRLQEKRQALLDEQLSIVRKRQREFRTIEQRIEQQRQNIRAAMLAAKRQETTELRRQADLLRDRDARAALKKLMHERAAEQWDLNRQRALSVTQLKRRELAVHQEKQLDKRRAKLIERKRANCNEERRDKQRQRRALALREERLNNG